MTERTPAEPAPASAGTTRSDPTRGLTSAEVAERVAQGRVNYNMELKTKSVRELVIENLCTVFNLINAVLALLVITTGSWKNLTFLAIVLLNTGIGVVQSLRSKRMVDRLTLLATKQARVMRDGIEVEVDLDQIVLDDVVRLGRGDQIPADAVVIDGTAQVNEGLLTGESNLIRKEPGSELMSGSFLDSGTVLARVVHVGADNYVAKINAEAKYVKQVNSEIMRTLNAIVKFAGVFMIPIGIGLLWASLNEQFVKAGVAAEGATLLSWFGGRILAGDIPSSSILSVVGALLGMIPQGLVLLTSSVLAIATVRLARCHVLVQQLYCIETLARVDVLCLDKTGTITSGRMQVAGTHPLGEGRDGRDPAAELDFALANIARATAIDANETGRALLEHYEGGSVAVAAPLRVVAFSSAKKWSGATFETGSFVMGAAQFVLTPEVFARHERRVAELADSCRVLVVARVDGFTDDDDIIGAPEPLGFVTIRDEIRTSAPETIGYFKEQGVDLFVISGDDPRTVSSIARVVGVPQAQAFLDATALDTPAKLDAAVDRYRVFGRVTPQQKRELVRALKRRGHTVAMTGDGVNDVLALKEADCSVAMAAGSDAARNVAEIVLVDNDFASMPAVVAEGRRSINNLQRSAAFFLTKTLFSMVLAAICIVFPPYPFEPIQMTLINFFCIGMPGFILGLEPNRARVEGSFLNNVLRRALPASLAVVAAACACMGAASLFGYSDHELSTMCLVTTSAIGACLIWRISRPFTPLRAALLAVVVSGITLGILFLPDFYNIAPLTPRMAVLLALITLAGCYLFWRLADVLSERMGSTRRSATGFGRGVRVSIKGDARRALDRARDWVRRRREERARAAEAAPSAGEEPPLASRGKPARRVSQDADGIRVRMPSKRRRG